MSLIQIGNNIVGISNNDQLGNSVSISSDGNTIVLGAPGYSSSKGLVQVYRFSTGTWSQIGSNIEINVYSQLGYSVSISSDGNTIVASATNYSTLKGLVQVYRFSSGSWSQIGTNIVGINNFDFFGRSLSISSDGNTIVVGASGYSGGKGLVQVYRFSSGSWSQIGTNIVGINNSDNFGSSVSISSDGNTIVLGAPGYSSYQGLVQVYRFSSGTWSQIGTNIVGSYSASFGYSVSISSDGNTIVAGGNSYSGLKGLVQVYRFSGGSWSQIGTNIVGINNNDQLGNSVSISSDGNTIVLGAKNYSSSKGLVQAYIYQLPPTITNFSIPIKTYGDPSFNITDPSSNSSGAFTYTSSDTSVATVAGNTITIVGAGNSTITATQAAAGNYTSGTATTIFQVIQLVATGEELIDFLNSNGTYANIQNSIIVTEDLVSITPKVLFTTDSDGVIITKLNS